MPTRSASPVDLAAFSSGPDSGRASPWSAQHETELRRNAEYERNYWKARAGELQEELTRLRAAANEQQGVVHFMDRNSSHFGDEVRILREKLRRWDKRNWAELVVSALKGQKGSGQMDYTCDIRDCVAFKGALHHILETDREECRVYLETHAFRVEKQLLHKMIGTCQVPD